MTGWVRGDRVRVWSDGAPMLGWVVRADTSGRRVLVRVGGSTRPGAPQWQTTKWFPADQVEPVADGATR